MRHIADKLIVILLCSVYFIPTIDGMALPVVILLTSLTLSELSSLPFKNKKAAEIVHYILILVFLVLCLSEPRFSYFAPVFIYNCIMLNIKPAIIFPALAVATTAEDTYSALQLVVVISFSLTAVLLCLRTLQNNHLEKELVHTRDEITEKNISLENTNKQLLNNQVSEIRLATLRERNRIAGDIHDNVGHMLSRLILQVGAMLATEKDETRRKSLISVKNTLDMAMTSIRSSVHDIRDQTINISEAIKDAAGILPERIHTTIQCDDISGMPGEIKYCIIFSVKECMSNIIKHSDADEVTIALIEHPAFYKLMIKDNGHTDDKVSGGMGLENMEKRVLTLGGTFNLDTHDGYKIFISLKKKEN